jgi:hypothetical protein
MNINYFIKTMSEENVFGLFRKLFVLTDRILVKNLKTNEDIFLTKSENEELEVFFNGKTKKILLDEFYSTYIDDLYKDILDNKIEILNYDGNDLTLSF